MGPPTMGVERRRRGRHRTRPSTGYQTTKANVHGSMLGTAKKKKKTAVTGKRRSWGPTIVKDRRQLGRGDTERKISVNEKGPY